jgi:hypothetical protein
MCAEGCRAVIALCTIRRFGAVCAECGGAILASRTIISFRRVRTYYGITINTSCTIINLAAFVMVAVMENTRCGSAAGSGYFEFAANNTQ